MYIRLGPQGREETLVSTCLIFFSVWWLRWQRIHLQCRRAKFNSWVGKILWRREWQPTPVFLPGELHGQRSLAGYHPRGYKELDMTERLTLSCRSHQGPKLLGTSVLGWKARAISSETALVSRSPASLHPQPGLPGLCLCSCTLLPSLSPGPGQMLA